MSHKRCVLEKESFLFTQHKPSYLKRCSTWLGSYILTSVKGSKYLHTILFRLSNLVKQICYNNDKKIKWNIAIFNNFISITIWSFWMRSIDKLRIPFYFSKIQIWEPYHSMNVMIQNKRYLIFYFFLSISYNWKMAGVVLYTTFNHANIIEAQ